MGYPRYSVFSRSGGGGSGGSIKLVVGTGSIGNARILAVGGSGGLGQEDQASSNSGGNGRVRIEYCNTLTGSTNPAASTQKLDCYIVEQVESTPYDEAKLNLPEPISDSRSYAVQYGRQYTFTAAGEQTQFIRLPKQLYTEATLDALVSNTGTSSGPLNLSLDIGNDGTHNWTHNATTSFPATLVVTDVVNALNAYLVDRTDIDWGTNVDVPVRVQTDRQGDVFLTNLALTMQFNQPSDMATMATQSTVNETAERPLGWTVVVSGTYSQGDWITYTHTLGPNAQTLHPTRVYPNDFSMLLGVGEYATDFSQGTAPSDMFGDGSDGDLLVSSNTNYEGRNTGMNGNHSAGVTTIEVGSTANFFAGDIILIHQSRGTNAGVWETNKIVNVSAPHFELEEPLSHSYADDGAGIGGPDQAQVLVLKQYRSVTVQNGATLRPPTSWDGSKGGIVAFLTSDTLTIEPGGSIDVSGMGFRGGASSSSMDAKQGESATGTVSNSTSANGTGGGGGALGDGAAAGGGGGGGLGSTGMAGQPGARGGGAGGNTGGSVDLTTLIFGGAGGGGGFRTGGTTNAGTGGNSGGIVLIAAKTVILNESSSIVSVGNAGDAKSSGDDSSGGGGGGSGGSILLNVDTATLGTNLITAEGGSGGAGRPGSNNDGGAGGDGRIRIEYCDNLTGSTSPPPSIQELDCYIVEQVEALPYDQGRINLPEDVNGSESYEVQYGRLYTFTAAGEATDRLRLTRQVYGSSSLEALISNTSVSSGSLDFCLDIGNDDNCDYSQNDSLTFPAVLTVTTVTDALNDYLLSRNDIDWGDPVDVPVRLGVNQQADIILTNLALTPVGSKTRYLRLPAQSYDDVAFDLRFSQTGVISDDLSFTVDVGADGSIDWSYAGTPTFPAVIGSPNLATAFNDYLSGRSGAVDVPIRIVPSPFIDTALDAFSATPSNQPDATLTADDINFSTTTPTEADTISVNATLHNNDGLNSEGLTAAFYATAPDGNEWYIGSDFVADVPAGGTTTASIDWNTQSFTGTVPVRVVADPYDRVSESNETNNEASQNLTILTRPDLQITAVDFSDFEPVVSETVTVTLSVRNQGQTDAGATSHVLYDGNPDTGGTPLQTEATGTQSGETTTEYTFTWTPTTTGLHRLFFALDEAGAVGEYDEGNNQAWRDVYVGFAGPIEIDSGVTASDPAYTDTLGYGYVDEGQPDVLATCDDGVAPEETLRRDPSGQIVYRFDHLQPGHFYHLDVILYECDGAGRQESIYVDGTQIAGPEDLGDGTVHRLSLRLDPAFYTDRTISVTIQAPGIDGAVVGAVDLHDIDYRYADAGGAQDPDYPGDEGYGGLDGDPNTSWGTLPYQSVRVDQADNELRYRFDNLDPEKNYNISTTFWQGSGTARIQKVLIDGLETGVTVDSGDYQQHEEIIPVPTSAYGDDGSIVVSIVRLNASSGVCVNF